MKAISLGRSRRRQRARSRWAIPITIAFVTVMVWPAAASALDTGTTTDDVTEPVTETTGVVEDTVEETTETVNEIAEDPEGAVTETVEDTTKTVEDTTKTVDDTTDTVNDTVSGGESEETSQPSTTVQSSDSETSAPSGSNAPTGEKSEQTPKTRDAGGTTMPSRDAPRNESAPTSSGPSAPGPVTGDDVRAAPVAEARNARESSPPDLGLDVAAALVRAEPPSSSAFVIDARPTPLDLFGSVVSGGRGIDGIVPPLSSGIAQNAVTLALILLMVAAALVAIGRATLSWDSRGSFAS